MTVMVGGFWGDWSRGTESGGLVAGGVATGPGCSYISISV